MAEDKKEVKKGNDKPVATMSEKDYRLWGALCYVIPVIVGAIVLLTDKKEHKKLQFHAWQSIIAYVVVFAVSMLTSFVGIGCLIGPLGTLYLLFIAYKVYTEGDYVIPTISEYAEKQVK